MSVQKIGLVKYPSDLVIKWMTYGNDSSLLLDFENKNFNRRKITIRRGFYNSNMYLASNGNDFRLLSSVEQAKSFLNSNPGSRVLAKITCEEGDVYISSPSTEFDNTYEIMRLISEKASKKIFGHFKSVNVLPIALNQGDEIRLGRVNLIVRHLAYNSTLPLSYLHDLISDQDEPERNPSTTCTDTSANINEDQSEKMSSYNQSKNTDEVVNELTNLNLENLNNNIPDSNRETTGRMMEPDTHSNVQNLSAIDSVHPMLAKELKLEKSNKNNEDSATVCDLSTSKTNLTTEGVTAMIENVESLCRICLSNDDTSGPLITPCNCKGSLNYVHLSCIRSWIKGRLNIYEQGIPNKSYFWQKLTCELCGKVYPNKININNTEQDFVDIEQPKPPYLVLEPQNFNDKGYFIVSLSNSKAVIGRGHEADIRLTDISVSRTHSLLYFQNNHFIVQDKRSKFGTLILSNKESGFKAKLSASNPIMLKIGNGILSVSVKRPFTPFICFGKIPSQTTTFSL